MKEFSIMLGVLLLWIALNRWVLPWFGVQTCMSGACSTSCCPSQADESRNQNDVLKPEGDR